MTLPPDAVPAACDVYRPFGAGAPTYTGVPCRLVADYARGQAAGATGPAWTHCLVLDVAADVRDGCTRAAGAATVTYADGDEVRLTVGGSTPRFVVVWVETVDAGTPREFKRAYLLRHTA
jgi:hypothetical protein